MSRVVALRAPGANLRAPRLALLGTGMVGTAFVARYERLCPMLELPGFAWLANSRAVRECDASPSKALNVAKVAPAVQPGPPPWAEATALEPGDMLVDATGSDAVAGWHAEWLTRGVHVVTANKLGRGAGEDRANAIEVAQRQSGAGYGDSATVGAGLPLLRCVRALVAGGDRIHRIEGVLSGSLAWLFNHFDGSRPFSELVGDARAAGLTEPDPCLDLAGEDVRRKLLILARAAGASLAAGAVQVESLLPDAAVNGRGECAQFDLQSLDAPMRERLSQAQAEGGKLRFVGSFDVGSAVARVGLRAVDAADALASGAGSDNCVAIYSDRYERQPLLIQGPGAGAQVTAAALLDDVQQLLAR